MPVKLRSIISVAELLKARKSKKGKKDSIFYSYSFLKDHKRFDKSINIVLNII